MKSIRAEITACLMAAAFATVAVPAVAEGPQQQGRTLDSALRDFARSTGLQLIYVADTTRDRVVGTVDSSGTPGEVLGRLLAGTDLKYQFLNERTVEIAPNRSTPSEGARRASYAMPVQAGGGGQPPVAGAGTSTVLDEVIVTARKREERLLDVPVAVTAFGGEALAQRGVNSMTDFLQESPGVSVYNNGGGTYKIAIRGISTSLGANENGYYLDDLPFTGVTVPISPDVRAWDLERVEVLRGPQGTLFGEGSMGGTVRILTRDPQFNEWQGQASLQGSDTASGGGTNRGYKATLNVPILDDRLALRVAATKEKLAGWITDPTTGATGINTQDIDTVRAKLRFQPTERLSIGASYWRYKGDFPRNNTADDDGVAGAGLALASGAKYRLYGATANYDFDSFAVFYSYANNHFELPLSGELFGGQLVANIDVDVKSNELRFSSTGSGPLQWTVGAYRRTASRFDSVLFALFGIDNTSATDTTSEALFGEATYTLQAMPIDFTLGLRSVKEKLAGIEANAGVPTTPVNETYRSTNPRVIVAWRPNEAWRLYASASKGYRSGQLQSSVSLSLAGPLGINLPAALADDSIWTYEIGTKASLAGGRAVLEAAVYHSDWKDVTVRIPLGTTGFNGLINSKGTTTNGVEASLTLQLSDAFRMTVMGSYADGKYSGDVPGTGIADGKPIDDNSKVTASASLDYRQTMFGDLTGSGRLGVQYNSKRDFPSFGPPLYLPGDAITTVSARFGVEGDWWGAFLFVDNLTNEDGAMSSRNVTVPGVTPAAANRPQPRTIGLEVRFGFGGR